MDVNELVSKARAYEQQIPALEKELAMVEKVVHEFESAKTTLSGLKTLKAGEKALIPIGGGVFLQGSVENAKEVMVDTGSKVVVKHDLKGAEAVLERHKGKLEKMRAELSGKLKDITKEYQKCIKVISEEMSASKGSKPAATVG